MVYRVTTPKDLKQCLYSLGSSSNYVSVLCLCNIHCKCFKESGGNGDFQHPNIFLHLSNLFKYCYCLICIFNLRDQKGRGGWQRIHLDSSKLNNTSWTSFHISPSSYINNLTEPSGSLSKVASHVFWCFPLCTLCEVPSTEPWGIHPGPTHQTKVSTGALDCQSHTNVTLYPLQSDVYPSWLLGRDHCLFTWTTICVCKWYACIHVCFLTSIPNEVTDMRTTYTHTQIYQISAVVRSWYWAVEVHLLGRRGDHPGSSSVLGCLLHLTAL